MKSIRLIGVCCLIFTPNGIIPPAYAADVPQCSTLERVLLRTDATFWSVCGHSGIEGKYRKTTIVCSSWGVENEEKSAVLGIRGLGRDVIGSTSTSPTRWSLGGDYLFITNKLLPDIHQPGGPCISRYSIAAKDLLSTSEMDDDRGMLVTWTCQTPVSAALAQSTGWRIGDDLMNGDELHMRSGGYPTVHYDIRAIDDESIYLYVTVNGESSRWLYDGKEWTLKEKYEARIDGPFLALPGGESVLAEHDGQWSVISDLHNDTPRVTPIVAKVEGAPLTVIEDVETEKPYFLQENRLYDDRGNVRKTLTAQSDPVKTLRDAATYVRAQRSE